MQKKPVQISSTTLSLRFMQNAAKAKQEQEVEAAKAKVKSEEEWEISPPSGKSRVSTTEEQSVTYEPSYLPFLFSDRSDAAPSVSNGNHLRFSKEDNTYAEDTPRVSMKGRRTFGKHGKEEIQENPQSEAAAPLSQLDDSSSLPRGARAISSHGRSAASPSTSSRPPKARHAPPSLQQPVQQTARASSTAGPPVYMKPQVDTPRADSGNHGKKRVGETESIVDGQRKKKKRKEKD